MDHSIDIGTKQVFVILRVTLEAFAQKDGAIQLNDCECIGLTVSDVVNGKNVTQDLQTIFSHSGNPDAILKDGGASLNKGVKDYMTENHVNIPIIDDLGHSLANALKSQFSLNKGYKSLIDITSLGAHRLRQTIYAFLTPPSLRHKGRFQSISSLAKWADKMLTFMSVKGRAKKGSQLDKFRKGFKGLNLLKPFIERFSSTLSITSAIQKLLKTEGLNQETHDQCLALSTKLPPRSNVKKQFESWLKKHIEIQKILPVDTLLVSSDVIESLFGKFKQIIERSTHKDMTRTVLLIPGLCGRINEERVKQAFIDVRQSDLKRWEEDNIKYTQRKNRINFFKDLESKNWNSEMS